MKKKLEQAIFDKKTHTYKSKNEFKLTSVTALLKKHNLAPDFKDVDPEILRKACERGTLVHEELQDYIINNQASFLREVNDFSQIADDHNFSNMQSELIVNNDFIAGTADLVCNMENKKILVDYKTSSVLNVNYVTWQTSIYAYLYNCLFNEKIDEIYAMHFGKDKTHFVRLQKIPDSEIEKLFKCEQNGTLYKAPKIELIIEQNKILKFQEVEKKIIAVEKELKQLKLFETQMKDNFRDAMQEQGIKIFDNGHLRITYVAPSTRTIIDTTRIKKELPEIAEKYSKTSEIGASVRITIKKIENEIVDDVLGD